MRLVLLGAGAMRSPRFAPAGVLVVSGEHRVAIDGGATWPGTLDAWLLTDDRAELGPAIRRVGRAHRIAAAVGSFHAGALLIEPRPVEHTSHDAFGYRIREERRVAVWAPEFWRFPEWAAGADLMFAEAAGWDRPIRFAGGVGGHACALEVSREAQRRGVKRLVFAHIGRPTIRAMDRREPIPFGEFGRDGQMFRL
jgi:hypothetical protein